MRKILTLFTSIILSFSFVYSENTSNGSLVYNNNTVNCESQPLSSNSWVKYVPITNVNNAPVSMTNPNACESHWYYWVFTSWYINKNIIRSCDDIWLTDWYVYQIICYNSSNSVVSCIEDGSWWTKYRIRCNYKFEDNTVEFNSAPFTAGSMVADWQDKNINITFPLSDTESNIDYIDFTFTFTDNTSLDWVTKNKNNTSSSAVYPQDSTTWNNFSWDIRTIEYRLSNGWTLDSMKNWDSFDFVYKFYNPTEEASDYYPSGTDWFVLNEVKYDVVFNDGGSFSWFYAEDKATWTNIFGRSIVFRLTPLFEVNTSWEVASADWFVEWQTQTWSLEIIKNSTVPTSLNWVYFSQRWTSSSSFNWSWVLDENNNSSLNDDTEKSILKTWIGTKFLNVLSEGPTYLFSLLFQLSASIWTVDDIKDIRLNQYIQYNVSWKTVKYLVGTLNKTNSQNFNTLKIQWLSNIDEDKKRDLVDGQSSDINNLAWDITKASLKRDIRKATIDTIKFVSSQDQWVAITNLIWNNWNPINWGKELWKILYYWDLNWSNVELNSSTNNTWKKTIVVVWWNLYINSNIVNSSSNDILWIIVLKDENWNGWKLYIDKDISRVDAVIYTDKSVISYNNFYDNWDLDPDFDFDPSDITKKEVDWNIANSVMQNQLYIYGSLFSENTIGWSRLDPSVCPFWTWLEGVDCTRTIAQRYDLNYLRAWVENKFDASYPDYPIVIKYNPALQSGPPPLFSK